MRASVKSIMAVAEALGSDGTLSICTSRVLRLVLMSRARTDSERHVEKALFSFSKRMATLRENMESGIWGPPEDKLYLSRQNNVGKVQPNKLGN